MPIFLTEPRAFERGHSAREPMLPPPRRMALRTLIDPTSGEAIDRGRAAGCDFPRFLYRRVAPLRSGQTPESCCPPLK
jgi:hypothetical protein